MATSGVDLSGFSAGKQTFIRDVAALTGLQPVTVAAWVKAENGPEGNPLNIGPGRDYGTPVAAASATVSLLRTSTYKPILDTASATDPTVQLDAIATSPWDAGHYTGSGTNQPKPGVPFGTTLIGALSSVTKSSSSDGGNGGLIGGWLNRHGLPSWLVGGSGSGNAITSITNVPGQIASDTAGGVATGVESWISTEAATGLAYVVLTLLGLALVFFGLLDVFGYSPRRVVGAMTPTRAASGGEIPF